MRRWKMALFLVCLCGIVVLAGTFPWERMAVPEEEHPLPKIIYVFKNSSTYADDYWNNNEFWQTATDGIAAGCREFGYEYQILGATLESDISGNIQAAEEAIAMEPEAIVLSAAGYMELEPYAQKIVESGILLVTMDSEVRGGWSSCFIGSDNFQVGRQMGEELKKRIPSQGKIAFVGHVPETQSTEDRLAGAFSALEDLEESRLLTPVYCLNYASQARALMLALLEEHPDIVGVIATNEDASLGVADAIAYSELQERVTLVTCDNSSGQISYLEQGVIDVTIAQKPFNMGYLSVQVVDQLLQDPGRKDIPEFYDTGNEVITVDNIYTVENQKLLFPFRG